jgi:hypothetical protein
MLLELRLAAGWEGQDAMIRAKFIEAEARDLLRDADIWRPPVPLEAVARHVAIDVRHDVPMVPRMRGHFDRATRTISLASLPARSERFAFAHELGHAQLDHGGSCSFEGEPSVDTFGLDEADVRLDEEAEADDFAGRLLVPRAWLRDRIDDQVRDELLAEFDVNLPVLIIAAMRYRLFSKLRVS